MIYFLTENRIKNITPIMDNADFKLINPLIKTSALMWVKPILGTHFFNYLLSEYNNQSLDSDELVLVDIIQNIIGWRTASSFTLTSHSQLSNKGPQTQYGDYSDEASITRLGILTREFNSKAEFFQDDLKSYLINNFDKYPEFTSTNNKDCFEYKNRESIFGNIFFT